MRQVSPLTTLAYPTVIRPLFCTDPEVSGDSILQNACILPTQTVTVYLKSELFRIIITADLTIQNIIFDGSEDISNYNSLSALLSNCAAARTRCCSTGSAIGSFGVNCYKLNLNVQSSQFKGGMFVTNQSLANPGSEFKLVAT